MVADDRTTGFIVDDAIVVPGRLTQHQVAA